MLAELFSWWVEQMRDLARPLLRQTPGTAEDALVLECDLVEGRPWRVVRRRNGERTEVASIATEAGVGVWRQAFASRRRNEPVVVALGQPFLVRRTTVPAAASANLERLLGYEMDRLTPFAADDVLFSHHVRSRDPVAGTLLVEVAVVPKAWFREPMERLAALSIRPAALEALEALTDGPESSDGPGRRNRRATQPGTKHGTGWQPADPRRFHPAARRILLDYADPSGLARARLAQRVLTGACVGLTAAIFAAPFVRQSLALAEADDQIARLRPRMEQVDELRRRIAFGSAGAGQIAAAREHASAALRVLAVVTDLLPDGTFLTSLSLRHDRLTIEGRSAGATKLIASMAADPHLKDPSFAAPVVRGENGTDVFTIQAGFGP